MLNVITFCELGFLPQIQGGQQIRIQGNRLASPNLLENTIHDGGESM